MKFPIAVVAFLTIGCTATTAFVNNNKVATTTKTKHHHHHHDITKTQLQLIPPILVSSSYDIQQQAPMSFKNVASEQQHVVLPAATTTITQSPPSQSSMIISDSIMDWFHHNVGVPPAYAADDEAGLPPTKDEINLLRQAFAAFYGAERDSILAEELLSKSIESWSRQPPDEQAGLYRVRGDCYMSLLRSKDAISDYTKAISLIQGPGGSSADPAELPAAILGRARAYRSMHTKITTEEAKQQADDYLQALKLNSREEWDTEQELLEDGARTNPYATWEYGMALRLVGDYSKAQEIHMLASDYFDDIGDRARSVISAIDAGIDAASNPKKGSDETAVALLKNAIQRTKTVEGRDIPLLQRVIAKEGEGRLALASVLWTSNDKPSGESQLSLACQRLDQLEADTIARNKINKPLVAKPKLTYNIDDGVSALDINCGVIKNSDYLTNRLEWPATLREKAQKLNKLG